MRIVSQIWLLVCLFKSTSPNNNPLWIIALITLIEHLGPLLEGVVGSLRLKVAIEGFLKISLSVSCVDELVILFTNAITSLMKILKEFLINPCRCTIISFKGQCQALVMDCDVALIMEATPYTGTNKLFMGNGVLVSVAHTGSRSTLLTSRMRNGLYQFDLSNFKQLGACFSPATTHVAHLRSSIPRDSVFALWHKRLGHPCNKTVMTVLYKNNIVPTNYKLPSLCSACQLGKFHKQPFSPSTTKYSAPFELVVSDLWEPACESSGGFSYYVSFVDAYTRYTWLYLIRHKFEALKKFLHLQKFVNVQFGCSIKFWAHAFVTAVYLIIRLPTPGLNGKSPHEMLPIHKGYKCLDDTGKLIVSRHVAFYETYFPFRTTTSLAVLLSRLLLLIFFASAILSGGRA
ncbi:hypothetical protein PVK06_030370 [Gossypium arboreum]|uniref:Retrovirus-related Pol polyprotein from transposon TNT 1-94 n=1 Tax=Gossypium arboreum TaxID=29729 RepID=A0ABR0NP50_GOSAR|nr:hypothetical protein PVK06_030370 [Gossypium arboreum]